MMRASYFIVGSHMCVVCFVLVASSNHHHSYDHHYYHYHHRSVERNGYGLYVLLCIVVQSAPVNLGW